MVLKALILFAGLSAILASNPSEVEFISLGDWGEVLFGGQPRVAQAMANWTRDHDPQIILSLGDNIYPWGIFGLDDDQIDYKWRDVYNIHDELKDLKWYMSIGNHDFGFDNGEEWNQILLSDHDDQWTFPHLWYDLVLRSENDQTSVHLIVIDTESMRKGTNDHELMWDWLEDTLAASTADWKIVVGHREVYAIGNKGPVNGRLNAQLRPLLEQYEIDVYLCGHDHNLQHIRTKSHEEEDHFVDYVLNGAGGALWYAKTPESEVILDEQHNMKVEFFEMTWGFVTVNASPSSLTFSYYNDDGDLIYEYSRMKN